MGDSGHLWGGGRSRRLSQQALCFHTEGQELLGVHIVECAQVGQLQQQFGETRGVPWSAAADQGAESPDEALLEHLHAVHILNAGAI